MKPWQEKMMHGREVWCQNCDLEIPPGAPWLLDARFGQQWSTIPPTVDRCPYCMCLPAWMKLPRREAPVTVQLHAFAGTVWGPEICIFD